MFIVDGGLKQINISGVVKRDIESKFRADSIGMNYHYAFIPLC